jgi:hypothetical protein
MRACVQAGNVPQRLKPDSWSGSCGTALRTSGSTEAVPSRTSDHYAHD